MKSTTMKRILILLWAALFLALPEAAAQVGGTEALSNDLCYLLTRRPAQADSCGTVYYAAGATSAQARTGLAETDDCRWAIWHAEADDLYYLYNLGAGKFLSADGTSCPLVSEAVPVELYYLDDLQAWLIVSNGYTVGLSPGKHDHTVFLGDHAADGNNGFLFTVAEASRQLTADEKTTIGEAVSGYRQARIAAYAAFVSMAESVATDGRDNYAGRYDYAALKAALAEVGNYTLEELEALYVATLRSGLPEAGKYYRLHNYARPTNGGSGNLLTVNGTAGAYTLLSENAAAPAPGSTGNRADDLRLFRLEATETDTVFYVQAAGPDLFFGSSGSGGKLPLVERASASKYRVIDNSGIAPRLFRLQNAAADNSLYLTANGESQLVSYGVLENPELWYFEEVTSIDGVSIGASGYATLCLPCPVELPSDLKAYVVTEDRDSEVVLTELGSDILPAFTPVILYREEGAATYSLPVAAVSPEPVAGNLLGGTTVRTDITTDDYVLANKDYGIGFYRITNAADVTLAAHKAYLRGAAVTHAATSAFRMSFGHGGVTGIGDAADGLREDAVLYDLSGRRVAQPSRGVFINSRNQKILIK